MTPALLSLAVAILGGAGLALALPGKARPLIYAGYTLLAGAGAMALMLLAEVAGGGSQIVYFVILSAIGIFGALAMVVHPKPVYSALFFILVVVATTGLLLLAEAEFLFAAVLIIYAGAILVTYVFVIMLAQQPGDLPRYDTDARAPFLGALAGFTILGILGTRLLSDDVLGDEAMAAAQVESGPPGNATLVGLELMTTYVIGLQLTAVLLLAAMVGAIAIARRRPEREAHEASPFALPTDSNESTESTESNPNAGGA